MKKLLNISSVGRMIVFVEILMCAVYTLSVFIVNGTDAISSDHISLMLLVALTITSIILLKSSRANLNKAVLWIAILPILFLGYEASATFFHSYEAQSFPSNSFNLLHLVPIR